MTLLRYKELSKMKPEERAMKLKDLRFEVIKANVTAHKANAKTKEIKRAVARLLTFNKSAKGALKQK